MKDIKVKSRRAHKGNTGNYDRDIYVSRINANFAEGGWIHLVVDKPFRGKPADCAISRKAARKLVVALLRVLDDGGD